MNFNAERCADLRAGRQEPERTARNTATLSELPGDTMRSSRNQSALCTLTANNSPRKGSRNVTAGDVTSPGEQRAQFMPNDHRKVKIGQDSGSTEGRAHRPQKRLRLKVENAQVRPRARADESATPDVGTASVIAQTRTPKNAASRNQARPAVTFFQSASRSKSPTTKVRTTCKKPLWSPIYEIRD